MPFEVFRRHQRKLMAVLALLAMFSFGFGDAISNFVRPRGARGGQDAVVAKLYGKDVRESDLERLKQERLHANQFVSLVRGYRGGDLMIFGGYSTPELVDAYILEKEADRMGLPVSTKIANGFLRKIADPLTNSAKLDQIFRTSSFADIMTDEQLLTEIANQYRIRKLATLTLADSEATPLDVFETYRDQNERVGAYAVAFPVADYTSQIPAPTADEESAFFDKYKSVLPNLDSPTPGFMIPQKVRFEVISADVKALTAQIRAKLTDTELRQIYDTRRTDFLENPPELPVQLFAGMPELTPHDSFPEVRNNVAEKVAEERAREEINGKLDEIRNGLQTFFERYSDAILDKKELPKAGDLMKAAAAKAGLAYETTPPIARIDSAAFGDIAHSRLGVAPFGSGPTFLSLAYGARTKLYNPLDLADNEGHRFLAWKIDDTPARVPTLAEVRPEVVKAWKMMKARPLAEAAAKTLAEAAQKAGGGAKIMTVAEKRPVIETTPQPKIFQLNDGRQAYGPPRASEIYELPGAGDAIRNAIFSLEPGTTAVAANTPETTYYALSLKERDKVQMEDLYSVAQGVFTKDLVNQSLAGKRQLDWMTSLRTKAGLPADWVPPNAPRVEDTSDME